MHGNPTGITDQSNGLELEPDVKFFKFGFSLPFKKRVLNRQPDPSNTQVMGLHLQLNSFGFNNDFGGIKLEYFSKNQRLSSYIIVFGMLQNAMIVV